MKDQEDYHGDDDFLDAALKRMDVSQKLVKKRLQAAKDRNREYYNKKHNVKIQALRVGDPVYVYNFVKRDKFDAKWLKGFRIVKQTGPVSFLVQNESGRTLPFDRAADQEVAAPKDQVNKEEST